MVEQIGMLSTEAAALQTNTHQSRQQQTANDRIWGSPQIS